MVHNPCAVPSVTEALPKTYDPAGTESRWQQAWESSGAFHPDPAAPGEPFSVVIPPPNVTGSLHMGHAFNTALIDTIVRFQRLQGKTCCACRAPTTPRSPCRRSSRSSSRRRGNGKKTWAARRS